MGHIVRSSWAVDLEKLWWRFRGLLVPAKQYRSLCRRCGRTGQAHIPVWDLFVGCIRFKPAKEEE